MRIALKRLRYALDFFGGVFESEGKKKFIKRLARLQEDLGRMNDVAVAETMLARLVGVASDGPAAAEPPQGQLAFAAGGILGWYRGGRPKSTFRWSRTGTPSSAPSRSGRRSSEPAGEVRRPVRT